MYILIAALVIAGWVAVFVGSRRLLKRTCAELRSEFQRQTDSLTARIRALEQAADKRTASAPIPAMTESGKLDSPAASTAPTMAAQAQAAEEVTPETLATIAETITALLGRKVRIRSVKILPTPNAIANPWAQQGRVVVQASHYLPSQRREP